MDALQKRIGYRFRDSGLLKLALTHPSLATAESNQRLEFLGDAVLRIVVARLLYDLYPQEQEGELSRRHSALVRGHTLTLVARDLEIGNVLIFGTSEIQNGGRDNPTNLEDALEALIGAIYLDGGIEAATEFLAPRWKEMAAKEITAPKDTKTGLQEWAQGRGLPLPSYNLLESTGPAHAPEFTIEVTVQGYPPTIAKAASKRVAEQSAAGILLQQLAKEG